MLGASFARPNLVQDFGDRVFDVSAGIVSAVQESMRLHPVAKGTVQEARRRFKWCMEMALELRHSMHWGVERIVDSLPNALASYLKAGSWEPDKRTVWVPTDGN